MVYTADSVKRQATYLVLCIPRVLVLSTFVTLLPVMTLNVIRAGAGLVGSLPKSVYESLPDLTLLFMASNPGMHV